MKKYWMVKSSDGGASTVIHRNDIEASCEAARLSKLNPGVEFHVMESIRVFKSIPHLFSIDINGTEDRGVTQKPTEVLHGIES